MRVWVIGSQGQLGSQIINVIRSSFCTDKMDIELFQTNSKELDITKQIEVINRTNDIKPNIMINCAAYTNVDKAEEDFDAAFKVNVLGSKNLAIAAESIRAKLVHISTDYIFDGNGVVVNEKTIPYREYDQPNPINVYGKTKLLGENYVREFCRKYFIIRTSWLYGENGNNFVKTIIRSAKEKGRLQVVNDQFGNPTNAEDLAYHILKLVMTNEYGIYHCTGNGICSWYDFACKIIEYAGIDCIVEPISSDKLKMKANRPFYSCLDNMMLRNTIGDNMREWKEALYDFIKNRLSL